MKDRLEYPRVYLKTNRHDDRAHPAHTSKFALRLNELTQDYYYYESPKDGHTGDSLSSMEKVFPYASEFFYLYHELEMKVK